MAKSLESVIAGLRAWARESPDGYHFTAEGLVGLADAIEAAERPEPEVHLFGLPGDEHYQGDIATVVDRWCDDYLPDPGEDIDEDAPSMIEEWSVQPAIAILPDRDSIIENIIERVLDDFGGDSDPFEDAPTNLRVLNAAEELRQAIAATCSWWWAKDVVATHLITMVDDEVHVDGEQFYSKGVRP